MTHNDATTTTTTTTTSTTTTITTTTTTNDNNDSNNDSDNDNDKTACPLPCYNLPSSTPAWAQAPIGRGKQHICIYIYIEREIIIIVWGIVFL